MPRTFAYAIPLINKEQIKYFWPAVKVVPDFFVMPFFKSTAPFRVLKIKNVRSVQEKEIRGYGIIFPLFYDNVLRLDEQLLLERIISAGHIAEQLNARILGLERCVSILGDKVYIAAKELKIPITNGNAFTSWAMFEAIYRVTKAKNIDLKQVKVAVVGAVDSIGYSCIRKLSEYVAKIIINAADRDRLEKLKASALNLNSFEGIIIEEDVHRAVKDADIVIITPSSSEGSRNILSDLRQNTIVCDISSFNHRMQKKDAVSKGLTIIDAGLIKIPYPVKFGMMTRSVVNASLAETMLLTFEERFTNYFLSDNINLEKLEEIADIAVQHGFEVWVPEAPVI